MHKSPILAQHDVTTPGALCRDSSVICVLIVKFLEAENLRPQASTSQMACLLDSRSKPGRAQNCWCQHAFPQRQMRFPVSVASLLLWWMEQGC